MNYTKVLTCCILSVLLLVNSAFSETLRMMVWECYAPDEKVREFEKLMEKKYGKKITIEVNRNTSSPNDFYDAVRGGKTDMFTPSHNLIKDEKFDFISKQLILPINIDNIPNYKDIIPALQKADYITEKDEIYGVPVSLGTYGLAYNTGIVKKEPDSWNILWQPEFKNKYSMSSDYYEANIYITALALGRKGVQLWDFESMVNNPEFQNKLKILAQNAASFWISPDKADNLTGMALAASWGTSFPELRKKGEIWKMADPKEGTTGSADNYVICHTLRDKPFLKKIAEEWLNYVLSPKHQAEYIYRTLNLTPVTLSAKNHLSPEEISELHLDDPDYFPKHYILFPTIRTQRDRNGMKFLWDQALKK
jgi:spermidine/putrescine-binding protein